LGLDWFDSDWRNIEIIRFTVRNLVYTAIAIAVGLVVLVGYFIQLDLLVNLRFVLLKWATLLVAVALLVGVVNLLSVHWRKSTSDHPNRVNSIVLIVAFVITLGVAGYFGPTQL
jgi:hypothetical protein